MSTRPQVIVDYERLSRAFIAAQERGDRVAADAICDEVDPLWHGMTADERALAEEVCVELRRELGWE